MKISVVCYRRAKTDANGVLKILINDGKKHRYISLKETIPFSDFNNQRVRKTNPNHAYYNNLIETELSKALILDKRTMFEKKQLVLFSNVAKRHIDQLNTEGSVKTFTMVKNHFCRFLQKTRDESDIDMSLLTYDIIEKFSIYLVKEVGISAYSRNKYMMNLKTIINYGIKKEMISYVRNPFLPLELKKEEPKKKNVYLNENEIYKLKKLRFGNSVDLFWLNFDGDRDEPRKLNPKHYADISDVLYNTQLMGLLQLASQGIRVSDLFLLRPSLFENNYFRFKQKKTGIFINIYLNEYLIEILAKIIEYKLITDYYDELDLDEHELILDKILSIKANAKELMHLKFNGIEKNFKLIQALKNNNYTDLVEIIEILKYKYGNDFFCDSGLNFLDFNNYLKTGKTNKAEDNLLGSATTSYNKYLKIIQKHAKITKVLSSHIFRHTFANTALTNTNDLYAISKALGHSSVVKTETYLREFDGVKVEALINTTISKIIDLGSYLSFELKE